MGVWAPTCVQVISDGYPRGKKELLGALSRFGPTETADWFRHEGVALKTEADGRMFPTTDDSQTIIDALGARFVPRTHMLHALRQHPAACWARCGA